MCNEIVILNDTELNYKNVTKSNEGIMRKEKGVRVMIALRDYRPSSARPIFPH